LRLAILSDIHGNYDALRAVLSMLDGQLIDTYACLGDIVGYGPQPAECIREIQKYDCIVIAGNHDYAVAEATCMENFNNLAKEAILWTRGRLAEDEVGFLAQLPLVQAAYGAHLVHGTLYAPELFDYVKTSYDAFLSMQRMQESLCFVGHSHVPVAFIEGEVISYCLDQKIQLQPGRKALVNVGSVGQPRDKDPRACCAVYDSKERTVQLLRVRYNIDAVVAKIREAGLPAPLGERLRVGR
jgi:predicted phosphodiesterase